MPIPNNISNTDIILGLLYVLYWMILYALSYLTMIISQLYVLLSFSLLYFSHALPRLKSYRLLSVVTPIVLIPFLFLIPALSAFHMGESQIGGYLFSPISMKSTEHFYYCTMFFYTLIMAIINMILLYNYIHIKSVIKSHVVHPQV